MSFPSEPSAHFRQRCNDIALPSLLEELAILFPTHPYLSVPLEDSNLAAGYRDISYGAFSRAANRAAWWLQEKLGPAAERGRRTGVKFPPVHYIGPQDLRFLLLLLAAVKVGYKLVMCHPAAGLVTHASLIEETGCSILLHSATPLPMATKILAEKDMETAEVPELNYWLRDDINETLDVFPYTKSFEDAYDDPFVVLHSSGTTGIPKPVVITHGCMNQQLASYIRVDSPSSIVNEEWRSLRYALLVPITIAASSYYIFGVNIIYGITTVLYPPVKITAAVFEQVIVHGDAQICLTSPKILPDIAQNTACLKNLRRLRGIGFVGAPCPQHIGRILAPYAKPISIYGSSEATMFPTETTEHEDWEYLKFPFVIPHEFRHVCHDNYELVVKRDDDQQAVGQGAFRTFPTLDEYPMKDLFAPHPTKPDLWTYRGRTDDLLVLPGGETFLPKQMEGIIETHWGVSAALVCPPRGNEENSLGLLIETQTPLSVEAKRALLEEVWPLVEKANEICPVRARVKKELILFAANDRPLPRGTKGFAQRANTLSLYMRDIEAVFQKEQVGGEGYAQASRPFESLPISLTA